MRIYIYAYVNVVSYAYKLISYSLISQHPPQYTEKYTLPSQPKTSYMSQFDREFCTINPSSHATPFLQCANLH